MKKTAISALFALLLTAGLPVAACAQELVVGGQIVGIQVSTEGVLVAEIGAVDTAEGRRSPAEEAGLKQGDLILEADGVTLEDAGALIDTVRGLDGAPVDLLVRREGRELSLTVTPARSAEGQWMLGMFLRDGISGIGTVTYYDPEAGSFGALGHSINDGEGGLLLPLEKGSITDAEVLSVTPGAAGAPGELNGCSDLSRVLGSVDQNTEHGIYGHLYSFPGGRLVETGELHLGSASILSTVNGRQVQEFDAQITRIYKDSEGEHVMLSVTDPELKARTGGIVQGMSGSPILQDGRLVAAVTHVFVSDPTRGYGISIRDMLQAAQRAQAA